MKGLKLADDVALPLEAVTQKLAWIGTTGSGKTYGASKLAELFWDAGAQFIVLDPVGVWYGLRLGSQGKKPSDITVPIFGGLHGDVPIESTSGALLADVVVDRAISAILDVSQFESDAQKARFAADFADRFFFRKKASPSAVHLFIEECQEFIPEHQQRGEERMLHAFTRLQKIGRNFGVGTSLITQRPQEVAKKALNLAGTLFVFRTTGAHERKAIEGWIRDKAIPGQDIAGDLPKLRTGAPHVWSPEWLELSRVVPIAAKRTFNASATPEVGAAAVARELAPIDLERIRADVAATIERAKADDPKELKKQIAEKDRRIKQLEQESPKQARNIPENIPLLTDVDRALLQAVHDRMLGIATELGAEAGVFLAGVEARAEQIIASAMKDFEKKVLGIHETRRREFEQLLDKKGFQKILDKLSALPAPTTARQPFSPPAENGPRGRETPRAISTRPAARATDGDAALGNPELKILLSLAELEAIGLHPADKIQLGLMAGYTNVRSGGFSEPLGRLMAAGYTTSPRTGAVAITDAGRAQVGPVQAPSTSAEMQARVMEKLTNPERKLLAELIAVYPQPLTKQDLGERCGYTNIRSGGFSEPLGRLSTLRLVVSPARGEVAAAPVLFLEGR